MKMSRLTACIDRLLRPLLAGLFALALFGAAPASAHGLNCVQYVQRAAHLGLHGDAWEWWHAAARGYHRGQHPKTGAILVFSRTGILPHGHVAIVRSVLSRRSILVDHANWSPIHGRRGQVERAVRVVDVSPRNDWSAVRVWYAPTHEVGQTTYRISGFIYTSYHPGLMRASAHHRLRHPHHRRRHSNAA
ncbi:CHAP domain protein [mine drainage metagenome]|uniref:CHAP domain protein n=1 Tax=mine drainage metagenome TaxID=410659 RepID=A0A1J5RDY6_9ZZZZ